MKTGFQNVCCRVLNNWYFRTKDITIDFVCLLDWLINCVVLNIPFQNLLFLTKRHICWWTAATLTWRFLAFEQGGCHTWPHDYKMRKYLSLKLDLKHLKSDMDTFFLIICRFEQYVLLNIFLRFWFINKTTAIIILVGNFDLRIFSVYDHGACCWMEPQFLQ